MKKIAVVTTSRADFGIWRPVLHAIRSHDELDLELHVTGMHLSPEHGYTISEIESEGFSCASRVECLLASDSPQSLSKSIGMGVVSFAQIFERNRPDLLLVLGDRFEMLSAVLAAMPFAFPIGHLHGGEATEGLIDEAIRHTITKMSHVHFAATQAYADRIIQMGESPWRVIVSGAPSLDNLRQIELADEEELCSYLDLDAAELTDTLLITFHPVTLDFENTSEHIHEVLEALDSWDGPIVFTQSNADTSGHTIRDTIARFCARHPRARLTKHLGTRRYFGLLSRCAAMLGNSSSGIIEAASFKLPVIDVGQRQQGRIHGKNVLRVPCQSGAIASALSKATSADFEDSLADLINPYGDGFAAKRITDHIADLDLTDRALIIKKFHDLPGTGAR